MTINDALYCVVDSETSGLDPRDSELLEIGAVMVTAHGIVLDTFETLVKPTKPLTADNSAIHGLIDEDFADALLPGYALNQFYSWATIAAEPVFVAHHAAFDVGFLPVLQSRPVLCSKRLAQHVAPDFPNHKNQTLRYAFRDVARRPDIRALGDAHRALDDARVTAAVLPHLIDLYLAQGGKDDTSALIEFAESPILLRTMPFGKHKGVPFSEIDRSYLEWAIYGMASLDRDLRYTMQHALGTAWEAAV